MAQPAISPRNKSVSFLLQHLQSKLLVYHQRTTGLRRDGYNASDVMLGNNSHENRNSEIIEVIAERTVRSRPEELKLTQLRVLANRLLTGVLERCSWLPSGLWCELPVAKFSV